MESIRRILVTRMKYIGDVILTTPLLYALRERYPDAHIAYLGDKEAVSLLEHHPCLDEVIPFDFSRPVMLEQPRVMLALRRRRFDVAIDLFSNPRSALLCYASGARIRIGKDAQGRGALYTHRVRDDGRPKTAVEFHYQYLAPLGIKPSHWKTEIALTPDEIREARNYLKWQDFHFDKPIIGLHPGATWPAKMWPAAKFADLADLLTAKLGAQVALTQGPRDAAVVAAVCDRAVAPVTAIPVMPLRQLAAIISQMAAYAANDNGTMHIAAAVGTKTVGIFGPGEENIWFPYVPPFYDASAGHVALRRDVPCHPCHLDVCNREGGGYMECMTLLPVKDVFEAIRPQGG
jgi:lipopolysaccharide heptosyltransferase II